MNFRFHIKNYRGRFHILIGLSFGQRGGLCPADYIRYTDSAFQRYMPIELDYEHAQQAQYALADIKAFLKTKTR